MIDKLKEGNLKELWFFPIIVFIMAIVVFIYNPLLGFIGFLITGYSLYYIYNIEKNRKDKLVKDLEKLDVYFDSITKNAIFSMPFPILILRNKGEIIWYNNKFKDLTNRKNSMVRENIANILPILDLEKAKTSLDNNQQISYDGKDFLVFHNYIEEDGDRLILLYLIDNTEEESLRKEYNLKKQVMMNIHLDNYDELVAQTPSEKRPLVFAEVDRLITTYFHSFDSYVKKYENDKYTVVLQQENLQKIKEDKFHIVDQVREVKLGNKIPPTLSIGIGINEDSSRLIEKSSNAALDIALGRGGDQVVIRNGDELEYYGGKNKATEKRTKVKARVIAHALGQLIEKSSEVFVMGHKNPDMDSFGSALGLVYASNKKGVKTYLVLERVTPAIRNIYNRSVEELEGLGDSIITPEQAFEKAKASSLLIVTDNHRKNSTEAPKLFEKTNNIVVIDHHRRGKDYIDNASLVYMEPYASSASELVTEMLMYMEDKIEIHPVVAEGLLAGITVDTKNFFYQTGVRTFEAASVLKRQGADSIMVKQLFKDDFEIIKYKSEIISKAEIVLDRFIIGKFDRDIDGSSLIASQAADDLLNIEGIDASFVLAKSNGRIHISARSLGDVSVQLIMERIGGGGHLTASATQLDLDEKQAEELLIKAISEYIEEENNESNIT